MTGYDDIDYASRTDVGIRRSHNQDSHVVMPASCTQMTRRGARMLVEGVLWTGGGGTTTVFQTRSSSLSRGGPEDPKDTAPVVCKLESGALRGTSVPEGARHAASRDV